jgi:alpha-mannosidase
MMILFGVGDHGGGPSDDMLARVEHLKTLDIYPKVEYGTTTQYINWLKSQDLSGLPVWKDELYLEYHQGTFTTQAKNKEWNRRSETLLTNLEKFSSFAYQNGGKYNEADIEEAWKNVLFNQFHDILPGSSIREVYIDAAERYEAAAVIGNFELTNVLNLLSGIAKTDAVKETKPMIIFNALNWKRSDIATVPLPVSEKKELTVMDFNGEEIPSQIIQRDKYKRNLIFKTDAVPPMGYEVYYLKNKVPSVSAPRISVTNEKIENEFFTILLDQSTGWIKSIIDKRNGKEILSGPGNALYLLEDKPTAYDAWNIGWTGVQYPTTLRKIEVAENGPVRATVKVMHDFLKPGVVKDAPTQNYPSSFFTQYITLYDGIDQIFFTLEVDWWEEKTMLKVAFPVTVNAAVASYEIPYGSIQRSTEWKNRVDSAKVEVPAMRWADLSQDNYGVSLITRAKYGYDIKGNVIRLSLLRSPKSPDPTADRGKHRIEYSLYPHTGDWKEAGTVHRGYEYNNSLNVVFDKNHKGHLPSEYSFVNLTPPNLILTTVKKMEGSNAVVYQWYDAEGKESLASLKLGAVPKKAVLSNFLEEDGKPLVIKKDVVEVLSGKNAVVTVKIYY